MQFSCVVAAVAEGAATCSEVGAVEGGEEEAGSLLLSLEIAAAKKLAMKNTSDIATMRSKSILDLLLVALMSTLTWKKQLVIFSMGLYCSHA
jgi:hypothetical protein